MKTREIQCVHYQYEGCCKLGKDCSFYGHCQTCKSYQSKPGGKPNRTDNRRRKLDRVNRKDKEY